MHKDFYTVKLNKTPSSQVKHLDFQTDFNGYFMVLVDKGHYGIFPDYHKVEDVQANMAAAIGRSGGSVNSSWNLREPLNFETANFQYCALHFRSVGYAP
jgi:hypothetical protein